MALGQFGIMQGREAPGFQHITLTLPVGEVPRCPSCGSKLAEQVKGEAQFSCRNPRHPRGIGLWITVVTTEYRG